MADVIKLSVWRVDKETVTDFWGEPCNMVWKKIACSVAPPTPTHACFAGAKPAVPAAQMMH